MSGLLALLPLAWAAWCDAKTRTVPNATVSLLLLCGLGRVLLCEITPQAALCGFFLLGTPLLVAALFLGGGNAIGRGDVKLCAAVGGLLGAVNGWLAVATALFLLACVTLVWQKKALPMAPFLLPAYLLIYIWS